ncbi:MAG: tetratricopeptide repeat protein [Candidatus Krumholzibacteriia bacterium]
MAAALLLLVLPAGGSSGQVPGREVEQARIEAGEDLAPRAQQILFRARSLLDDGKPAEAAEVLAGWLAGDPARDHALLRYELANARLAQDDETGALADLQAAVRLEPRFARAWLRLGETAYGLERYAAAAEGFARGYALTPDPRPEFLHYAGVCDLLAGRPDQAAAALSTLLTDHRAVAEPEWYRALVAAALESADPGQARPFLDHLLADRPSDPASWELAAQEAAARDDYRTAAVLLTVTGYLRPLTPAEWRQLGDLYAVIEVPRQAARCYERALQADGGSAGPDETAARAEVERLASAWLAAHDLEAARRTLRQAMAGRPTASGWALLGDVDLMDGDFAAASEHFGKAVALDPEFGRGHLMLGYCSLELDRPAEARRHLERALAFPEQATSARDLLRRVEP